MKSYRDILISIKSRPRLTRVLKLADIAAVLITVAAYAAVLVVTYLSDRLYALKLLAVSAVPFILVSILRRIINAPRPYELHPDIYDLPPKKREGCSFPSRHVFSSFSIGTAICFVYPLAGAALILLGAVISVSRVLLGKHFTRDVIAGALIGAVTSVIGMIIMIKP